MIDRILIFTILLTVCFSPRANAQATTLTYTGAVQTYVVPAGVTQVTIDASGASGGNGQTGGTNPGGAGARLVATLTVTPGETLNVVVGGVGASAVQAAGGGGGSFVYRTATQPGLLLAAAGGGGATSSAGGGNGSATSTAGSGSSSGAGSGGASGNGGAGGCGGGGGGLLTDGGDGLAGGGKALANGAAGGSGGGAAGGFGGGGSANGGCHGGGGGGGYNGGGGGGNSGGVGGGGGSYSATIASVSQSGINTGDGQVILTPVPADVSITKSGPGTVFNGNNITYTITVTNNGPSDALSVSLSDPLPAGTTFVSETQNSGPAFTCTNPSVGANGTVSCTLATLANGASAGFTIIAKVISTGSISNTATVTSTTPDPNGNNNSQTSTASASNSADLSITKTGPAVITSNSDVTYLITVSDAGPSNSQGVTVTDVIPAGTTFVSAAPSQGSCSGTSTVTCSLGTIAPGSPATITLVLHVGSATAISNTASVSAATADPNPGNNTATTATVPLTPAPSSLSLLLLGLGVAGLFWGTRRRADPTAGRCC